MYPFIGGVNAHELATLTPLEIDEHLAKAGTGNSDSIRRHDVVALQRLRKFALDHKLLEKPVFGNLEKLPVGRRHRVPTATETDTILAKASPAFRLIYSALRQCGARPGELCRTTIADADRANTAVGQAVPDGASGSAAVVQTQARWPAPAIDACILSRVRREPDLRRLSSSSARSQRYMHPDGPEIG
ncbi:MAG: hypothetical protein ACM3U2_16780 [Deltaproteobacteria bacterium]